MTVPILTVPWPLLLTPNPPRLPRRLELLSLSLPWRLFFTIRAATSCTGPCPVLRAMLALWKSSSPGWKCFGSALPAVLLWASSALTLGARIRRPGLNTASAVPARLTDLCPAGKSLRPPRVLSLPGQCLCVCLFRSHFYLQFSAPTPAAMSGRGLPSWWFLPSRLWCTACGY